MRGCRRPPLLLVVLEGVVPLLLLPLHSPGKPTAAPSGSTAPAADTPASSSMGETRPDRESVLSSGPWPATLPLRCPAPAGAQNAAAGMSGIAVGCACWCWSLGNPWRCSVAWSGAETSVGSALMASCSRSHKECSLLGQQAATAHLHCCC